MKLPKHAEGRKEHDYYNTSGTRRSYAKCNFCRTFTYRRLMVERAVDGALVPMALCEECYDRGHR